MPQDERQRLVKVTLIQQGPVGEDKQKIVEDLLKQVDEVAEKERPDFMMPIELCTTPYFCGVQKYEYFDWAEPIPGPSTELFAEKAKKFEMVFLLPIFEKGRIEGVYYNATVVLGPDGNIIEGTLPDGSRVNCYRKNQIPRVAEINGLRIDERFYFREGPGFCTFDTPKAKIGVVICFDRRFPESWRMCALQGVEIAFNPACAMLLNPKKGASTKAMYNAELQTRALENSFWVANTNKAGVETVGGVSFDFYGLSAIYHPTGAIVVKASDTEPQVISATIDVNEVAATRQFLSYFKFRRPDAYTLIGKSMV
jgi:N-carbamoylputrescine amidase